MSSLAAARADNFYYAPDFNPDVHKSLNKVQTSHSIVYEPLQPIQQHILCGDILACQWMLLKLLVSLACSFLG